MTTLGKQLLANDYYCRAMQMIEDHQEGRTEFVRMDEVFGLLYDMASDFYEIMHGKL